MLLLKQKTQTPMIVEPPSVVVPMDMDDLKGGTTEVTSIYSEGTRQNFAHKSAMISGIRSDSVCRNYRIESSSLTKSSGKYANERSKNISRKQVDAKLIAERLASKEAREEILVNENTSKSMTRKKTPGSCQRKGKLICSVEEQLNEVPPYKHIERNDFEYRKYSVENIPLYDSEDDEPTSKFLKGISSPSDVAIAETENKNLLSDTSSIAPMVLLKQKTQTPMIVEPLSVVVPMDMDDVKGGTTEVTSIHSEDTRQNFAHKSAMISRIQSDSVCRNYRIESSSLTKSSRKYANGRSKNISRKQVDAKLIAERLASKEGREEILVNEEKKNLAASQLESLYDEIRPAVKENEGNMQVSVPTSVAEKWIGASCQKMKSEFDFYSAIIKNIACTPRRNQEHKAPQGEDTESGI